MPFFFKGKTTSLEGLLSNAPRKPRRKHLRKQIMSPPPSSTPHHSKPQENRNMVEPNRQADALLTEHFRYTPLVCPSPFFPHPPPSPRKAAAPLTPRQSQSLIDEIINAVNTIIYRALEAIENGLFSIPPPTLGFGPHLSSSSPELAIRDADGNDRNEEFPEAKEEIEEGVHRLETLLEATVDRTFDKFEIYTLRNILTVPDELAGWMRLGHYEVGFSFGVGGWGVGDDAWEGFLVFFSGAGSSGGGGGSMSLVLISLSLARYIQTFFPRSRPNQLPLR